MDWSSQIIDNIAKGKKYKGLLQVCISNMKSKKLYKFYDLDSSNTKNNLLNDTIYMQDPALFNDPLDCNIGMSADALFEQLIPMLMSGWDIDLSERERDLIKSLLTNREQEVGSGQVLEIIFGELLKNPATAHILSRSVAGEKINSNELLQIVTDQPELLSAILKYCLHCDEEATFTDITTKSIVDIICKSPAILRNILPSVMPDDEKNRLILSIFSKDEGLFEKIRELAVLSRQDAIIIKLDQIESVFHESCDQLHKSLGKSIGVSCFTESPENMLMWSHYANKHTGICVEYDFGKPFESERDAMLFPVMYSDKRPLLPLEKMLTYNDGSFSFNENDANSIAPDILKSLVSKGDVWLYENEWRLIKSVKDISDRFAYLPIISRIIVGCNIPDEQLKVVNEIANEKGVPVSRCILISDKYRIRIV